MKKWFTGGRGVALMILTWIVGWGLGFGGIAEILDPHGQVLDVWPTAMAVPGFIGGILFSALLRFAERGRSYDEVSLGRFVGWSVVTGIVLGLLTIPAKVGDVSPGAAGMTGILTGLGAIAGLGSWIFVRLLARRGSLAIAEAR